VSRTCATNIDAFLAQASHLTLKICIWTLNPKPKVLAQRV
jgi:hypothetical protein